MNSTSSSMSTKKRSPPPCPKAGSTASKVPVRPPQRWSSPQRKGRVQAEQAISYRLPHAVFGGREYGARQIRAGGGEIEDEA